MNFVQEEDKPQGERFNSLRMVLSIGKRQCRAPGSTEDMPFLNLEFLTEALNVLDKIPGGILGSGCARGGFTRASLIKEHDLPVTIHSK